MLLFTILLSNIIATTYSHSVQNTYNGFCEKDSCHQLKKYIFYDVNPAEGFNLRRDVYMRFAIMLKEAPRRSQWNLVLPPWPRLYHWRSHSYMDKPMPWRSFFDIEAMKSYVNVVELEDIFRETRSTTLKLDRVFVLENFDDPFENGEWEEKWDIVDTNCQYYSFWDNPNITAAETICVKFQGKISKLWELVSQHNSDKYVMFVHGEIPLHNHYGNKQYWDCRKSMKFSKHLVSAAEAYMLKNFVCKEKCKNYVGLHWRRQDFVGSHYKQTPSMNGTAVQLHKTLKKLGYGHIFIASDAGDEFRELINELYKFGYEVYYFKPTVEELKYFKDGGVAIIDQIICSHSYFFIGTYESTFTFRIQEEREILGIPSDLTFNRLCPDSGVCEKPSRWTIIN